jgi:hypothetical protein
MPQHAVESQDQNNLIIDVFPETNSECQITVQAPQRLVQQCCPPFFGIATALKTS